MDTDLGRESPDSPAKGSRRLRRASPELGLLAQSSHLPHVLAAALVNAIADEALEIAARGFLDTTRIASGDAALWRDICMANRPALLEALRRLDDQTAEFRRALKSGDAGGIERFLARGKERRDGRVNGERAG